ncbi:MAG TPA: 16S rRNA methyltransferase [Bacteroidetes bacterium]|nr:16S rRNA methyltransferase [Bacteroidota bacterium]HRR09365.1 RsmE family RNA methyltransferase [Rhodothermales bacterium]
MTTQYFASPACFEGNHVTLPPEEARHVVQVLRHGVGEELAVTDGAGGWFRVVIRFAKKNKVIAEVVEKQIDRGEPSRQLSIGLALLKSTDRYEWFLEKAVELGVTAVYPLLTHHTEMRRFKPERAEKVMIAALKQCGRTRLPFLHPITELQRCLSAKADARFLLHEKTTEPNLFERWQSLKPYHTLIVVGPEGGFSEAEILLAREAGWHMASLGSRRLRAETAAVMASGLGVWS